MDRLVSDTLLPRVADRFSSWRVISPATLAAFREILLDGDDSRILDFARELLADNASLELVFLDLFTPAARELGRLWEDDDCSMTHITLAASAMQRAVRQLAWELARPAFSDYEAWNALVAAVPGEWHTLGCTIASEILRHAGWRVNCAPVDTLPQLFARIAGEDFDLIGLSVGRTALLPSLPALIARLREYSRNPDAKIVLGGPAFVLAYDGSTRWGADAIVEDGADLPRIAESLLGAELARA